MDNKSHKLPDNWYWTKLNSLVNIQTGKKDANYGDESGKYPFFTCASKPIRCNGYSFEGKYIILAGNGDIGNIFLYDGKFEAYQRTYLISTHGEVNINYVYYYFKYKWLEYNIDKMFGSTIPYIRLNNIKDFSIPLPPLEEQQHIVDRIENLFEKLNKAKALVQSVVNVYKLRRLAMLHKVFIGKLIKCDFQIVPINSICKSLIYGTSKKSAKFGKVIVIRMGNLQNGEIDWTNLVYTDDKEDIEKYSLSIGDVLFNRTNSAELVGKTSIYRGEHPAIYAGYLIKLDYDHEVLTGDYLNYMLNSPEAKEYCQRVKTDGVNQSNINAKKIGAFEIPIPNLEDQKEIVRILDSLLAKELRTKELAEQILQKIDLMKKAILARAFRGEL